MPHRPIAWTRSSTRRVETPAIHASWITATSAFSTVLPGLQEAREVAAGAQLRDLEVERAEPGVEAALAVAVALGRALGTALVPAGADQALDVGLHDQLQHALRHRAEEVRSPAFASSSASGILSSVIGGPWARVKSSNSTVAGPPDDHPTATPDPSAKLHHDHGRYLFRRGQVRQVLLYRHASGDRQDFLTELRLSRPQRGGPSCGMASAVVGGP